MRRTCWPYRRQNSFLAPLPGATGEVFTAGKTWQLECDIDLSGTDFAPMGIFNGTLEGNGHTISGLTVSGAGSSQGLFRFVGESGVVRNLNVEGEISPPAAETTWAASRGPTAD